MNEPWINSASQSLIERLGRTSRKGEKLDLTMLGASAVLWFLIPLIGVIIGIDVLRYDLEWIFLYTPAIPGLYILQREYRPSLGNFGLTAGKIVSRRTCLWSFVCLVVIALNRVVPYLAASGPKVLLSGATQRCGHWPVALVFAVIIGPPVEELVFRGYLYLILRQNIGRGVAAVLSSAAFGILHGAAAPLMFAYGLIDIYFDNQAASLIPSLVGHIAWNGTLLLLCRPMQH